MYEDESLSYYPFEFELDQMDGGDELDASSAWPLPYDPSQAVLIEGPIGSYPDDSFVGASTPTLDQTLAQLQQWGQQIGQGIAQWPTAVATPIVAPIAQRKADEVGDKAMAAADTLKAQATDVGEQAKRTLAVAQAQMLAASRDVRETSQHTRATADVAKYVLLGVGGLAAAALLVTIIKQAT
jgi:hypothetical protein